MAQPQAPHAMSRLESLPAELMNAILGELIGTETSISESTYREHKPWPKRVHNAPCLSTAILRTNKNIHGIAKSYLDDANKWIVLDMDHVFLLLPWICTTISLIVVDPESKPAVPDGVLHMRVKLHLSLHHKEIGMMPWWPKSVPSRQTILLPLDDFGVFLHHLRTVEIMNGIHLMPGHLVEVNGITFPVKQGCHGLSICVHVKPGAAASLVQPLLEALRKFHGPLNEVSIVNSPNPLSARAIETSIAVQPENFTVYEFLNHVVKLITLSTDLVSNRQWHLAHSISNEVVGGITNTAHFMRTPWTVPPNFTHNTFELLILQLPYMNAMVFDLHSQRRNTFANINAFRDHHIVLWTHRMLEVDNTTTELRAWVQLTFGLWQIFSVRFYGLVEQHSAHLATIQAGINIVDDALGVFDNLSSKDGVLMKQAKDLLQDLLGLAGRRDPVPPVLSTINQYRPLFADVVDRDYRPVRWMVPESMISEELVSHGVLDYMTKESEMKAAEANQYLIMNAFEIDFEEEGEDGEWYCL